MKVDESNKYYQEYIIKKANFEDQTASWKRKLSDKKALKTTSEYHSSELNSKVEGLK